MKIHFKIPKGLRLEVYREFYLAKQEFELGDLKASWHHLERAHILGQAYPIEHTKAHWKMLLFAFKIKSIKEIIGQIPRLLFGGIKSFVGEIPVGNTGGSNVPPLKPMEIPQDLLLILKKYN
jgi:hypothetical protein